jgi:tetratricopeptide (TPR) repeat protein
MCVLNAHRLAPGWPLLAVVVLIGCSGSPHPGTGDDLAVGVSQLCSYRFDQAQAAFARAAPSADPTTSRQARLGLATCWQHATPATGATITEAENLYRELARGTDEIAALATLQLGRLAELIDYPGDRIDLPQARTWYRATIERWPESPRAGEAEFRLLGTDLQSLDPAQMRPAMARAETYLAAHPRDPWTGVIQLQLSDAYLRPLGDRAAARRWLRAAISTGLPDPNQAWQAWWRLARLSESLSDPPGAIAAYRMIILHFPTSGKCWEAQQALRRLGQEPPPLRWFDASLATQSEVR